ncbi:MAG: NAD(+) diphosphatase [Sedimenticola sp.]|nr:MAG: NAD(+) diphosphatase [Sedimenticola sp.]
MKTTNHYSGCRLDRMDAQREDSTWLERVIDSDQTQILPLWRNRHPVSSGSQPKVCTRGELGKLLSAQTEQIFLGMDSDNHPWVAVDLSHLAQPPSLAGAEQQTEWFDLRKFGTLLDHASGALLAYARAMVHWNAHHRFCNRCGHPAIMLRAGHQRQCTNSACAHQIYPRIDPAVIMLIHHGDLCLLGRQPQWPAGRHSVLAGYVEPGESLEDAVRREVQEEVGIDIEAIHYHSSQAWPFPSSIMLGFYARAKDLAISLNDNELESAAWFDRDSIRQGSSGLLLPSRDSIAYRLIGDWLDGRIPG